MLGSPPRVRLCLYKSCQSVMLFSPVHIDQMLKCDAHFLFKLASRLKFSHRIPLPGVTTDTKKILEKNRIDQLRNLTGPPLLTAKRQTMETSVWENSLRDKNYGKLFLPAPESLAETGDRCVSCRKNMMNGNLNCNTSF